MRFRVKQNGCAGLVAGLLLLTATEMRAQQADPALAETLFSEGIQLFEQGKHAEACPKFAASHKADPGHGAVSNLGLCYLKVGKTASAWAAFREAAAIAKNPTDAAEDTRQAAALEPKLLRIQIGVDRPEVGLTVTRDGNPIDRAAWGTAVPVDPGSYRIDATAPGKKPWSTTVLVEGEGKTAAVHIPTLLADTGPTPSASASAQPAETPKSGPAIGPQRVIAITAGGVGLVGLLVGGGLALAAKSKWDSARPHCDEEHFCDPIGLSEGNAAHSMAQAGTWVFVAGGVALAAGVTLWLTAPSTPPSSKVSSGRTSVAPWVGQNGGGLVWQGRF